mgnify:CR=1 FL=1
MGYPTEAVHIITLIWDIGLLYLAEKLDLEFLCFINGQFLPPPPPEPDDTIPPPSSFIDSSPSLHLTLQPPVGLATPWPATAVRGIGVEAGLHFGSKKPEFLDKSLKTTDILPVFFEPKWSPGYSMGKGMVLFFG